MTEKPKEVKIADKIKFWEEQDRINKSLIPRVVKMHEMITDLSDTIDSYSNAFGSLEVRVKKDFKEETKKIQSLYESLKNISVELNKLAEKNTDSIKQFDNLKQDTLDAVNESYQQKLDQIDTKINTVTTDLTKELDKLKTTNRYFLIGLIFLGILFIMKLLI